MIILIKKLSKFVCFRVKMGFICKWIIVDVVALCIGQSFNTVLQISDETTRSHFI